MVTSIKFKVGVLYKFAQDNFLASGVGKHFILASGTNLVLVIVGIATGSLTARILGPQGRGELATIQISALFLVGSVGYLGVPDALVYMTGQRRYSPSTLLFSTWVIIIPVSLLWAVVGVGLIPLFFATKDAVTVHYAQLFMLLIPLAAMHQGAMTLQGQKLFGAWSLFRLHMPIIYATLLGTLAVLGYVTPINVAEIYLISSTVGAVTILGLLYRAGVRLEAPSRKVMRDLLNFGVRSLMGSAPEQLNAYLDQLVIAVFLHGSDLGLYVVAVTWSMVLGPIFRAVADVLFPHLAATGDQSDRIRNFTFSVRTSLLVAFLTNILVISVTPFMMRIIFGQNFLPAVPVSRILLFAACFYYLKLVLGEGMKGLGFPEAAAYAELTALVSTVILLVLLLPGLGIVGAGVASLGAYLLSAATLVAFAVLKLHIPVRDLLIVTRGDIEKLKRRVYHPWLRLSFK